jgi:hypothetical protein
VLRLLLKKLQVATPIVMCVSQGLFFEFHTGFFFYQRLLIVSKGINPIKSDNPQFLDKFKFLLKR